MLKAYLKTVLDPDAGMPTFLAEDFFIEFINSIRQGD